MIERTDDPISDAPEMDEKAAVANGTIGANGADSEDGDEADPTARMLAQRFRISADGVWYRDLDPDKPELHLCGPIEVLGETRDADGHSWGALLAWYDGDGRRHQWAMPREMLAGDGSEVRRELLDGGLYVAPGRKAREQLNAFLAAVRTKSKVRCVARIGWHDHAYVMPDVVFGDTAGETVILQTARPHDHAFAVARSLADWQRDVAALCEGNSRLMLAVSAAFAAPLLNLAGAESGGFHLRGPSSIGKTAALVVAGSVWGGGGVKGYIRQWRATDNGLEAVAAGHCDALLCLDELSQIDAKAAGAVTFMLANGTGKSRARRGGEARAPAEWRVLFLSSGEIGLADKIAEDGRHRRLTAGQQVRVIDVPADAGKGLGLFKELHGHSTGDTFAQQIKTAASVCHGAAARAFLEVIAAKPEQFTEAITGHRDDFIKEHCPPGADGQVLRVAARFGLVAAAGELATALEILPWARGGATVAVGACFGAWLDARGGSGPTEVADGICQVLAFLSAHGSSRFETWGESEETGEPFTARRTINRAGWRRKDSEGRWEYLATAAGFREMTAGFDGRTLARELIERSLLIPDVEGKSAKPLTVPGHGKVRLYHFPANTLGGGSDDA